MQNVMSVILFFFFTRILHQKDVSLVVVASATFHGWSVYSVFCSGI